ncbi:hypothetical protein D3C75_942690 [compost metagenome]
MARISTGTPLRGMTLPTNNTVNFGGSRYFLRRSLRSGNSTGVKRDKSAPSGTTLSFLASPGKRLESRICNDLLLTATVLA